MVRKTIELATVLWEIEPGVQIIRPLTLYVLYLIITISIVFC